MFRQTTIDFYLIFFLFVRRILFFMSNLFIGLYWYSSGCKPLLFSPVSKFVGLIHIMHPTISRNVLRFSTAEATICTRLGSLFTTFGIGIANRCGQSIQIFIHLLAAHSVTLVPFLFLNKCY